MDNVRYCVVQDDDSHWYLIAADLRQQFDKCLDRCEESDVYDEFEKRYGDCRISGPHNLTFTNPLEG